MAVTFYLKIADIYKDNREVLTRALLRCAKIYEDKDDLQTALGVYMKIAKDNTEESRFARERIEWIKARIK